MSDLIYRQDAIDALMKCGDYYYGNDEVKRGVNQCIGVIHDLPSAQPERRGEWIYKYLPAKVGSKILVEVIMCSKCRYVVQVHPSNFCPNCKADMRGESE